MAPTFLPLPIFKTHLPQNKCSYEFPLQNFFLGFWSKGFCPVNFAFMIYGWIAPTGSWWIGHLQCVNSTTTTDRWCQRHVIQYFLTARSLSGGARTSTQPNHFQVSKEVRQVISCKGPRFTSPSKMWCGRKTSLTSSHHLHKYQQVFNVFNANKK